MPKKSATWQQKRDPLFRGDGDPVASVDPKAHPSIVRHVLYLGGPGRSTPYHSTSEEREVAAMFAKRGRVWRTAVSRAKAQQVEHISRLDLLGLLKGKGHGAAKWKSAFEVLQARRYVERWSEHLLSYRKLDDEARASEAARQIFE
ncbi:MAG: hypothetical protein SangKO_056230 [Sandaracinaceae bacterium]